MKLETLCLVTATCQSAGAALTGPAVRNVYRDVAIIGGGSAGTYTAVQLRQLDKSVALIERLGQLGGNVNTFEDPTTKELFDVGVIAYDNIPVVKDYFNTLGIGFQAPAFANTTTAYADFKTGAPVNASQIPGGDFTAALQRYQAQLQKYPYLVNGYGLPAPADIPADFFLPWRDFIKKYNLEALAYTINTYNQGAGNILDQPTLYIFKYLNPPELTLLTTGASLTTTTGGNQHIYDTALSKLGAGKGAFVNSTVTSIRRGPSGVQVSFTTPSGPVVVHARKLVVAIRPLLPALQPFLDLRADERSLFAQWNNSYYWCGLVRNSGLPADLRVLNADPASPYAIPRLPALYSIQTTSLSSGAHSVYFGSPRNLTDAQVEAQILAEVARVRKGLGYPAPYGGAQIEYFRVHNPFLLTVSPAAVKKGFYGGLEGLQGKYDTFWTGAAWQTEDSSAIWNYTRAVTIPGIVKSLS